MVFGDFIVLSEFVCVIFVDTKTDLYKQGQWATFAVSERPSSDYQLMQRLLQVLMSHPSQEIRDNMSSIPVIFRTPIVSFADVCSSKISYNEFLIQLKSACSSLGLDADLFGTHSMRR